MAQTIHVAVLDVDAPMPAVYAARGLYSSQFRVLLQAAAARLNKSHALFTDHPVTIHTSAYDVVGHSLPPLEYLRTGPYSTSESASANGPGPIDAILITGSAASAYERGKYPWIPELQSFIVEVYTKYPHVKIFGSCFGHQIIAQALLSTIHPNRRPGNGSVRTCVEACPSGYEIGIHPIQLNKDFTAHFAPFFPKLSRKDEFRIQLIHGDRVIPVSSAAVAALLPRPWINLGSTPLCPVQGLYLPRRVLTYQGHFEFDSFVNRETCLEFARRAGWERSFVEDSLVNIERATAGSCSLGGGLAYGEGDQDDSRLAAEMVVVFFRGWDGDGSGDRYGHGLGVNVHPQTGMITPPFVEIG